VRILWFNDRHHRILRLVALPGLEEGREPYLRRKLRQRRQVPQRDVTSRRALQWLIALAAIICLPAVATVILISRTSEPDLFDLVPKVPQLDGYSILAWPDLERAHHALKAGALSSGARIRALGYMMDGDRSAGDHDVSGFILLPDAGNAFHPAHRFGDQMISVRLEAGKTVRFHERGLVWAWGTLRALPGDASGQKPLYILDDARTQPADKAEIPQFFKWT